MSARDLSKRLSHIRNQKEKISGDDNRIAESSRDAGSSLKDISAQKAGLPEGWQQTGAFTYRRDYDIPIDFPEIFEITPISGCTIPAEKCVFFDTETTGLSGGAGTIAFLIGIGRVTGRQYRITQYFLADFPGEKQMLRQFLDDIPEDGIFISYNGKTFDSHLLESRFILHRIQFRFTSQVDLLYPARKFWKHLLDSCSLSSIEQSVLGVERFDDVPGREVPEYYFTFLKNKRFRLMEGVFSHNKEDVLSLMRLLIYYHNVCIDPLRPRFIDNLALGKLLLDGNDTRGLRLIRNDFEQGKSESGLYLGNRYKRLGQWEEAVTIWNTIWNDTQHPSAGIALAKYYEHIRKDYSTALDVVSRLHVQSGDNPGGKDTGRAAVEHRKERLMRKLERGGSV